MTIHPRFNCRHFCGDRPCAPHKQSGVVCASDCPGFSPHGERILIVKLGAPGDVLRTTCILPELKKAYPQSSLHWLTRPEAVPLLTGNPLVDEIVPLDCELLPRLLVEEFDRVLCLDNSADAGRLAELCQAPVKRGFGCNARGQVRPLNTEAQEWFLMGLSDPLKQANRKSYPQIVHEIAGLPWTGQTPILALSEAEKYFARQFAKHHGLDGQRQIIGLFTGAGSRWKGKNWPESHWVGLIELLLEQAGGELLLLGGPNEVERNGRLLSRFAGRVVDSRCDNSLREFVALVGLCDVLVTADTLALHVATAQQKNVVVLVGPTSAAEIELYGRGMIVGVSQPCRCYYQPTCDSQPPCMASISPQEVLEAVLSLR